MDPLGKEDGDAGRRSDLPLYSRERVSSHNGAFRFFQ